MKYLLSIFFLSTFLWTYSQKNSSVLTVYFSSNSSNLSPSSITSLEKFVNSDDFKEIKLDKIIAYCDTVGSVDFNKALAERRLNSVLSYLSKYPLKSGNNIISGENYPEGAERTTQLKEWRKVEIHYSPKKTAVTLTNTGRSESSFELLNLDSLQHKDSKPIVLDIQFYPGVALLFGISESEINKLAEFLKENEQVNIFIRGHVCCNDDYPLSQARAMSVYEILIAKGIEASRMQYEGYSNTIPAVTPEITDLDRQKNRRVDVIFSVSK